MATVEALHDLDAGRLLKLRIEVLAERGANAPDTGKDVKVLDWQLAALIA